MHAQNFPFQLLTSSMVRTDANQEEIARTDYQVCTVEYIASGGGFLETNGIFFEPRKDSVYFLHKHSTHRYWPDRSDPWFKLCFVVDGDLADTLFRAYHLEDVHFIPDAPELKKYFDTILSMNPASYRIQERAAVVFHEFVESCAAHYAGPESDAPQAIAELKEELIRSMEEKFDLSQYCKKAKLSIAYVIRSFHRSFGCAPVEYRMRKKLEAAERLLLYSDFSVKEISASLGFTDQYAFSNFFRTRKSIPPTVFRKDRRFKRS